MPSRILGRGDFGNWELSSGRANAARRTLVIGGYPEEQIARVVGYASSALFDRKDPFNPVNRRIDILVLTKKAQRSIEGEQSDAVEGAVPAEGAAPVVQEPLQAPQLRERLNIFEDGVLQFSQPGGR